MKITIVGGGSAGWITAFLISKSRPNIEVELIESDTVNSVGVGEGTTGKFLEMFSRPIFGIDFTEMFISLKALPKMGINFINWSDGEDFISPVGVSFSNNTYIDYASYVSSLKDINPTLSNLTSYLAHINYTNLYFDNNKIDFFDVGPGLHVDAQALIDFFKQKSIDNGVKHIIGTVVEVNNSNNKINYIRLNNAVIADSDFFIDCTGFSRQLIKSFSDVEWIDYSKYLPVNTGMPFKIKETLNTSTKKPYTNSIAMDSGWVWEIPTGNKIGRGYVFSDLYSDKKKCIEELENYYQTDVDIIKEIKFSSGRISKVLSGNCLSVGLSAAFFEPLQATSLHCTLHQIDEFINLFLQKENINLDDESVAAYNKKCAIMYEDMKDFIFIHYTGKKRNTPFWEYFTKIEYPEYVKKLLHLNDVRLLRDSDFKDYHGTPKGLWLPTILGLGWINKNSILKTIEADINIDDYHNYILEYSEFVKSSKQQYNFQTIKQICNKYYDQ